MKQFPRRLIKFLLSVIVSLLIGWWAYLQSGAPDGFLKINLVDWYQIPLLCLLIVLGGILRSWRLGNLFQLKNSQRSEVRKILFFSASASFLLGGIGFLIRLFLLKKRVGVRQVVSLGLISVEKFIDSTLAFIIAFFFFTIPENQTPLFTWINEIRVIILISFFFFFLWFFFHPKKIFQFGLGLLSCMGRFFPPRYYYFGKRQVFYLYKCLTILPTMEIVIFIGKSLLVFGVESLFYYFGLKTLLNIDISLSRSLLLNAVIILALTIPLFPSGIGLFQAAIVFILGKYGGGDIFYASLLLHFFLIITHIIILSLGLYQFFDLFKLKDDNWGSLNKEDKRNG